MLMARPARPLQIDSPTARLTVANEGPEWAAFAVAAPCTSREAAEGALPQWLDVYPAGGYLAPKVC